MQPTIKNNALNLIQNLEIGDFAPPKGHQARAYHIPIHHLESVRADYKDAGINIRVRYRGPRTPSIGRVMKVVVEDKVHIWTRTHRQAMQDCLKADAKTFSVYNR